MHLFAFQNLFELFFRGIFSIFFIFLHMNKLHRTTNDNFFSLHVEECWV